MSWSREFSSKYAVPGWFSKHFVDESYHNDSSPSFSYGKGLAVDPTRPNRPDRWIVVWVEHPDPGEREDIDYPRYSTQVWLGIPGDYGDPDIDQFAALETEDLAEAARHVQKRARELGLPPPPLPSAAGQDVSTALAFINRERARTGLRPLDPVSAGWNEEDILREADRLRSPNPLKKRLLNA